MKKFFTLGILTLFTVGALACGGAKNSKKEKEGSKDVKEERVSLVFGKIIK